MNYLDFIVMTLATAITMLVFVHKADVEKSRVKVRVRNKNNYFYNHLELVASNFYDLLYH